MHYYGKVTEDLFWVGANDRRLAMFEGVYSVPKGVSYNSYLLLDEQTVLFDTADKAVSKSFLENVAAVLADRELDYIIVQHVEPDHSAVLINILTHYPSVKVVCNAKSLALIKQFYDIDIDSRAVVVKEYDTLTTGRHMLNFIMAPMVHWPEVMVTYDSTDKILFSADAFGCFGALNGALFADEVDFAKDYMDETRRYYANIVGKYGTQVSALLEKASTLVIEKICPLHGFIWRDNIKSIIDKYLLWSSYEPEEYGVMIAYASVYGNTENAAEILAGSLRERGIKSVMYDVSVTHASEIVAAAFRYSHLVFASTTYNAGIFVSMNALIDDLVAHNIQNRTVGIIENGSWAPTSGGLIREKLSGCRNMNMLENTVRINSGIKTAQLAELNELAEVLANTFPKSLLRADDVEKIKIEKKAVDLSVLFKLTYGLFVLSTKENDKDNGCIINTVTQITEKPLRISIAVNKLNLTHDMIKRTGEFNISILSEKVPFRVFERFGFSSGRDSDKFSGYDAEGRMANGILYISEFTNGVISAKVEESADYDTHTLFVADVTESLALSDEKSVTYQYYFDNIKPKPRIQKEQKKGMICRICGYVYDGEVLPDGFICPLCKHPSEDFEPM